MPHPHVQRKVPKRLLNPSTGFLSGYSHTLNPYTGCSFGCSYCYVRQSPVGLFRAEEWGTWVDVKDEAADRLRKELKRARAKGPVTIFMSSSTDPYQPLEVHERITRSLLEVMAEVPPDFLFVQTRSPLVTRDLDLFKRLEGHILVSVTVETDREDIRRMFSPAAPPIAGRLRALRELTAQGIPAQAAIAPLLPSTEQFAAVLAGVVSRVCVDTFAMGDGSGGKRTQRLGIGGLYRQLGLEEWYEPEAYHRVVQELKKYFPEEAIFISKEGFLPVTKKRT